jgi:hypothetical protein
MRHSGNVKSIALETSPHLSCLAFFTSQEGEALKYLQDHLESCVQNARNWCAACYQTRGEEEGMLTCGGCKVARSVLPLLCLTPL